MDLNRLYDVLNRAVNKANDDFERYSVELAGEDARLAAQARYLLTLLRDAVKDELRRS